MLDGINLWKYAFLGTAIGIAAAIIYSTYTGEISRCHSTTSISYASK